MGLVILPFDSTQNRFLRLSWESVASTSSALIQTSDPAGTITIKYIGGGGDTYTAQTFLLMQQVQTLLDNFVLSGQNIADLSNQVSLQLFQAAGAPSTVGMIAGQSYLLYGAGIASGCQATLTNAAKTLTLPVVATVIGPGMISFIAPDNAVPPYNGLDAGDTNILTLTNPAGASCTSDNATVPVLYGWS